MLLGGRVSRRVRGSLWSRRGTLMDQAEPARLEDLGTAVLLQHLQNQRSPLRGLLPDVLPDVFDAVRRDMAARGGREAAWAGQGSGQWVKVAEGLLQDGRLAYPREHGAWAEALVECNCSGLAQLRSAALAAGAGPGVAAALDRAVEAVRGVGRGLPLASAASAAMGAGGVGEADRDGVGATKAARVRELVQVRVGCCLLRVRGDAARSAPRAVRGAASAWREVGLVPRVWDSRRCKVSGWWWGWEAASRGLDGRTGRVRRGGDRRVCCSVTWTARLYLIQSISDTRAGGSGLGSSGRREWPGQLLLVASK